MFGNRYSLNNHNPTVYRKDDVGDLIEGAGDFVSDEILDPLGDVGTFLWNEVLEPVYDFHVDLYFDAHDYLLDSLDYVTDDIMGFSGVWDYAYDVNRGSKWIAKGIGDGNWDAIKAGAMVAVAITITALTLGSGAQVGAALAQTAFSMGVTNATVLMASYYVASSLAIGTLGLIMSIYNISSNLAMIGQMIATGNLYNALKSFQVIRDAMNLAFVNTWINGSMGLWMAGGILYDAPRAGDLMFNPSGSLATTKFLGLEGHNQDNWYEWNNGRYHDFQSKILNITTGTPFYAVAPLR